MKKLTLAIVVATTAAFSSSAFAEVPACLNGQADEVAFEKLTPECQKEVEAAAAKQNLKVEAKHTVAQLKTELSK